MMDHGVRCGRIALLACALVMCACGRNGYDPVILGSFVDGGSGADGSLAACAYECTIVADGAGSSCVEPAVTLDLAAPGTPKAIIDMSGYALLRLTLQACDPTGWSFNLGDSPTNNGFGGDAATSDHDAEIEIFNRELQVYDSTGDGDTLEVLNVPGFLPETGCTERELVIGDQRIDAPEADVSLTDPELLRINPPEDSEGEPDALWYLGLNTVYYGGARTGTGTQDARLCFIEPVM